MFLKNMVVYPNFHALGESVVVYVRHENKVFFSGLNSDATSTINAVEPIIRLICTRENSTPSTLQFYDLQTHRGYANRRIGDYVLSKILFKAGVEPEWLDFERNDHALSREIPHEVLVAFHSYIN